jgi:hypothetical protein
LVGDGVNLQPLTEVVHGSQEVAIFLSLFGKGPAMSVVIMVYQALASGSRASTCTVVWSKTLNS